MFTITDEQPENYQLQQGKKVLNESHIKKAATTSLVHGLEKGCLQSHETNTQLPESNIINGKNKNLHYGRIFKQDKLKLYSANDAQGGLLNNFFDSLKNTVNIQQLNKDDAPYQKMNIESLDNI